MSPIDKNKFRPVHEIAYAHYVGVKNLKMKYTGEALLLKGYETVKPVNA